MTSLSAADHTNRSTYDNKIEVFDDARRVIADLVNAVTVSDGLFPEPGRVEFLARRSLQLIDACIDAERGRP